MDGAPRIPGTPARARTLSTGTYAGLLAGLWILALPAAGAADLRLGFARPSPDRIQLTLPADVDPADLRIEESAALGPSARWITAVAESGPGVPPNTFAAQGTPRYFRLRRSATVPFRVEEVSPVDGESGVSVTRETVLTFSAPLAADAFLGTDRFRVEAGGRRLLGRVGLSSDRRTAIYFLQEPAPGNAQVRVTLLGDGLFDERGRELDADGDGQPGGTRELNYSTFATAPVPGTAVIGRVFASDLVPAAGGGGFVNHALAGVTVTVDGAEQEMRAVTDITGGFTLTNCPAGRFFVHIDGRTAVGSEWPDGAYYPFVGKAWTAVAGSATNLAGGTGEIYLPRVPAGTLKEVSALTDTEVTFPPETLAAQPELAGVRLIVPPNALFNEYGVRGGRIGIAPVPPDRLPEPLPPGLDFPIVITVQTDGPMNFDRPVPIRFPNLPDRITGVKAAPGTKLGLWGFNHDLGRWVVEGSMTVSADGAFVESDPGSGVRQPGWGSFSPASGGGGGGPKKEEPEKKKGCDDKWLDSRKAALAAIAQSFRALPGRGRYSTDHLQRFLNGPDTGPVVYGPDSGPAQDVLEHPNFDEYHQAYQLDLEARIRAAVHDHPDTPIVPDYGNPSPIVSDLDFYSDSSPGITSQLAAGFGGVGHPKPNVSHVSIVQNSDGSITYVADFDYDIEDDYEFDAEDGKLTGPNAWARDLEACGKAHPFKTTINVHKQITATIRPFGGEPGSLPAGGSRGVLAALDPPAARGPALGRGLESSLLLRLDTQQAVLQTDGSLGFFSPKSEPPAGDSFCVVRDLLTGVVVSAGTVGPGGQPPSGLIVLGNRRYRYELYHPGTRTTGYVDFTAPDPGLSFELPPVVLHADTSADDDGDGLGLTAEGIVGTDPARADTDGDGRNDGQELAAGTNPLDGQARRPGPIASVTLDDPATAIATTDGLLAVTHTRGVSIFDIAGGLAPRRIAEWRMESALAVAARGRDFVAVSGQGQVVALRLTATGDLDAIFQTTLTNFASASFLTIGVSGDRVFVPSGNTLRTVHLDTGAQESRVVDPTPGYRMVSVAVFGDLLVALDVVSLRTFTLAAGTLQPAGRYVHQRLINNAIGGQVFLGDGYAVIPHALGFDLVSVDPPEAPAALAQSRSTAGDRLGNFISLADTGGPLLATVERNNISWALDVFDNRSRTNTNLVLAEFVPPSRAARVAVQDGRAYVAALDPLLLAYDFVAPDADAVAPQITLQASFSLAPGRAEAGHLARVVAHASDDLLVRDVEFFVDGQSIGRDGSYPFDAWFTPRPSTPGQTRFTLQARATDLANRTTWTPLYTIEFATDATPPALIDAVPAPGGLSERRVRELQLLFDEALDPAAVSTNLVWVTDLGPDGKQGTADDRVVPGTVTSPGDTDSSLRVALREPLGNGSYLVTLGTGLRDTAGNPTSVPRRWTFEVRVPDLRLSQVTPLRDSELPYSVVTLVAEFDAPIDARTLSAHTLAVSTPGPDGTFGTADDLTIPAAAPRLWGSERRFRAELTQPLGNGVYRVAIASDLRGFNPDSPVVAEPWTFTIKDPTPPTVVRLDPREFSSAEPPLNAVTLVFSEPMLASAVAPDRFTARNAGPDFQIDTPDDVVRTPARVVAGETDDELRFEFASELAPGTWVFRLAPPVTDPAGNPVKEPLEWTLFVQGRTTVVGVLANLDGKPASGASVTLTIGANHTTVVTGPEGRFTFPSVLFRVGDAAVVEAAISIGERQYHTRLSTSALIHAGITDLGPLRLRERLAPAPGALVTGDFNRDGRPDLAVAGRDDATGEAGVWLVLGQGDGSFAPGGNRHLPGRVSTPPTWIAAADLDRDGRLDLVTIDPADFSTFPARPATVVSLLANSTGGFPAPVASTTLPTTVASSAIGDATGTDFPDAAFVTAQGTAFAAAGKGDGTFASTAVALATNLAPDELVLKLAFLDVDGNGRADRIVAAGNRTGTQLRLLVALANPDGGYAAPVASTVNPGPAGDTAFPLLAGDFDGDGKADLLSGEYGGVLRVFRGLGAGAFAARRTFQPTPFAFGAVAQPVLADLDADGRTDVVTAGAGQTVIVWLGQSDGSLLELRAGGPIPTEIIPALLATGDFDGDGRPDILVVSGDGEFQLLRNGTDF